MQTDPLGNWARRDGGGLVFDWSTGFNLPNGATRSPDVGWVLRERIEAQSAAQRRDFLPLAPDLVIELASPTDDVPDLLAKMREYQDNGVRLGWLILPGQRQVQVLAAGAAPRCLEQPQTLSDADLLPGLASNLTCIWRADCRVAPRSPALCDPARLDDKGCRRPNRSVGVIPVAI